MHRALTVYTQLFKDEVKTEVAILNRYWKLFLFHFKNQSFIMGFEKPYSMISICDTVLDKCKTYSSFLFLHTPPQKCKCYDFKNNVQFGVFLNRLHFFKSSLRFMAKFGRQDRDFCYTHCPTIHSLIINIPNQVVRILPTLTHHYRLDPPSQEGQGPLQVLSFYELGQIHNDLYLSCLYQTNWFHCSRTLCPPLLIIPYPPSPNRHSNKDRIITTVQCWQQKSWTDHPNTTECLETGPNN